MRNRNRRRLVRLPSLEWCEHRRLLSVLTVTSTIDGATGSLRSAIGNAAPGDVIQFSPKLRGARLPLTLGELVIDKSLTIQGSGQTLVAQGKSRVIEIDGPGVNVSLSKLRVAGGVAGLISTPGPAYAGGGILVEDATLSLNHCNIVSNRATGSPGGDSAAAIPAEGGGLLAFDSQISLTHTIVSGNLSHGGVNSLTQQASPGGGGGLFFIDSQVQMAGGQIQGNFAQGGDAVNPIQAFPSSDGGAGDGGGVLLLGSNMSLYRVTISGNEAVGGAGLAGRLAPTGGVGTPGPGIGGTAAGGAIFTEGTVAGSPTSTLSMIEVSINRNLAQGGPAGMALNSFQPAVPGGQALGGAIEQLEDTTLVMHNAQFEGNGAHGGAAAVNIPQGGGDTSSGGEAFGGAIDSEFFTRISGSNITMSGNVAEGSPGGNSAPNSETEAGVGGPAQGGAWNLRDTGGLVPSAPLPVTLTHTVFQNNQALAGPGGSGLLPSGGDGAGGYATGGAMQTNGIFNLQLTQTKWLNNQAIAQQGEFAFGGALGMSFGFRTSQTRIANSLFKGNLAQGGNDPQHISLRGTSGGAILNNNPNTTIVGTALIDNTARAGNATGIGVPGNAHGGAIDSTGNDSESLTLASDRLIGNRALAGTVVAGPISTDPDSGLAGGGAVFVEDGSLNVARTQFARDVAQSTAAGSVHNASGGALYVNADTTATLTEIALQSNQARALGGNSAFGGGVANFSNAFTESTSLVTGNQAVVQGGGAAFGGGLYLANDSSVSESQIAGNAALASGSGQGFGGGIAFANDPTVSLQNVVVHKNRATTAGPDLYGDHQSG
jgi:hypothetical protein